MTNKDTIMLPREVGEYLMWVLEMVEPYADQLTDYSSTAAEWPLNLLPEKVGVAITALRSYLDAEQPKQEPVESGDDEEFTREDVTPLLLEVMYWTYAKAHRERPMTKAEQKVLNDIRNALAAEQPKPEPVAWQERHFFPKVGEWTHWYDCRPRMADYPREQIEQNGVRYQWRPLYPAPPDSEALRRDAERWRFYEAAGSELTLRLHNTRSDHRNAVIDAAMQEDRA